MLIICYCKQIYEVQIMNSGYKTDYKNILMLSFCIAVILIIVGTTVSFNSTADLFLKGALQVRNASFEEISFANAFRVALKGHIIYTLAVLIFAGGFQGIIVVSGFLVFKTFSIGATLGLVARECIFQKAAGICFGVLISNIIILPLYIIMFLVLFFYTVSDSGKSSFKDATRNYFSFAMKVIAIFAVLCAAECVQSALGTLAFNNLK